MAKKQLMIIPGLGDRQQAFRIIKPLWKLFGFEVHFFIFGWNNDRADAKDALRRLVAFIDALPAGEVYIIGVSAGGTAAINAFAKRPKAVAKVVTLSTPYKNVIHHRNALLMGSMGQLQSSLTTMPEETKRRILSVHGLYDRVVAVGNSRFDGIASKRVWAVGHGVSIGLALTVYSGVVWRFLSAK